MQDSTGSYEPKRRPLGFDENIPEFGDMREVQRIFGLRETLLYQLLREGKIKSVVIRARGNIRGKRLFSYASIRDYLNSLAEKQETDRADT